MGDPHHGDLKWDFNLQLTDDKKKPLKGQPDLCYSVLAGRKWRTEEISSRFINPMLCGLQPGTKIYVWRKKEGQWPAGYYRATYVGDAGPFRK